MPSSFLRVSLRRFTSVRSSYNMYFLYMKPHRRFPQGLNFPCLMTTVTGIGDHSRARWLLCGLKFSGMPSLFPIFESVYIHSSLHAMYIIGSFPGFFLDLSVFLIIWRSGSVIVGEPIGFTWGRGPGHALSTSDIGVNSGLLFFACDH